jgi:hypothetical protein
MQKIDTLFECLFINLIFFLEVVPGFEPRIMVLQTIALPLGYTTLLGLILNKEDPITYFTTKLNNIYLNDLERSKTPLPE